MKQDETPAVSDVDTRVDLRVSTRVDTAAEPAVTKPDVSVRMDGAVGPGSPIALSPVFIQTEFGPIRGFLVTVDLGDPRVEVVVSGGAAEPLADPAAEVVLTPTDAFTSETGCALAVNANFFRWLEDADGNKTIADIVGLSVTDGVVVSAPRVVGDAGGVGDPALVFDQRGRARVLNADGDAVSGGAVWDGVAGIGASDDDATPGTLLVIDGQNHGATARPGPNARHPRTAAGVDADGDTLVLAVIDGRRPGHSIGITLVELGELMIDAGADDAVNLDGGGSTALLVHALATGEPMVNAGFDDDGDGWITNRPSDGRYRPVANNLGVRLRGWTPPNLPGQDGPAPVRGTEAAVSVPSAVAD